MSKQAIHHFSFQLNSQTGLTPLMWAAERGADETVAYLLSKGASPDIMSNSNFTALQVAIQSKCSSTIDLLAPGTKKGLGGALRSLAAFNTDLTPAVEDLLRRAASDEDALRMQVAYATKHLSLIHISEPTRPY